MYYILRLTTTLKFDAKRCKSKKDLAARVLEDRSWQLLTSPNPQWECAVSGTEQEPAVTETTASFPMTLWKWETHTPQAEHREKVTKERATARASVDEVLHREPLVHAETTANSVEAKADTSQKKTADSTCRETAHVAPDVRTDTHWFACSGQRANAQKATIVLGCIGILTRIRRMGQLMRRENRVKIVQEALETRSWYA